MISNYLIKLFCIHICDFLILNIILFLIFKQNAVAAAAASPYQQQYTTGYEYPYSTAAAGKQ